MISSVLFACTLNAVRSPMAEAIFRHFHGKRIFSDSCGVRPGEKEPDPFMVAAMEELGIDLRKHKPKTFEQLEDSSFDLIVSLSPEAQHHAVEMTRHWACEVEFWPTFDATLAEGSREVRLDAYRQVRDHLMKRILARFPVHKTQDV